MIRELTLIKGAQIILPQSYMGELIRLRVVSHTGRVKASSFPRGPLTG